MQEASVAYETGRRIANDTAWTSWNAGIEYGTIRETSDGERR